MARLVIQSAIFIALIMVLTFCDAQDMPPKPDGDKRGEQKTIIQKIDVNSDDMISHSEFVDSRNKLFSSIDTNSNGRLSLDEFNAYTEKWFANIDANSDGAIDCDEATSFFMHDGR